MRPSGDAGALTNKLVLTKDNPIGDVAFGVDNTFASRALDEGVFAAVRRRPPGRRGQPTRSPTAATALAPVDQATVCVNVDTQWFADHDQSPPQTLDDLADPAYKDDLVIPGAPTSSPGMAFLLSTIAEYGEDGWQDYWTRLMANGAKLTSGWSDAYYVDFTRRRREGHPPDRALLRLLAGVHRRQEDGGSPRPRRCSTPASARSSTPGCWPARRTPRAPRRSSTSCSATRSRRRCPTRCTSSRSATASTLPADWARFASQPADAVRGRPGRHRRAPRRRGCASGRDVTSR